MARPIRGMLPTERPDYLPYSVWRKTLRGSWEALDRAFARLWVSAGLYRLLFALNRKLAQLQATDVPHDAPEKRK